MVFSSGLWARICTKKKRSKVGLFNRLSQCQFANAFSQEKEKKCSLHLPFGCETSQLLLSKQIIARNQYWFPWLCSILRICEVSKLFFNVIVAPTNKSMYKKVRFRLFRSGRPFIRSSPLSRWENNWIVYFHLELKTYVSIN